MCMVHLFYGAVQVIRKIPVTRKNIYTVLFSCKCILSALRYAVRKKIYLAGKVYCATFFIVKSCVETNRLFNVFLLSA